MLVSVMTEGQNFRLSGELVQRQRRNGEMQKSILVGWVNTYTHFRSGKVFLSAIVELWRIANYGYVPWILYGTV